MSESYERWAEAVRRAIPTAVAYQTWKRTRRGRLAIALYPYSRRAYVWLARKDGWA